MVIRSETGWSDMYTLRMISGNKIPGLLEFQEKWLDGIPMYYYDITSKQPLSRLAERRKITGPELRTLISDFILVLKQMERFLLDEQRICLNPECIYIDPETCHGSFCLIPGYHSDFSKSFFELAQYVLDHVDHGDGEAVILAFSMFRESRKDNFGIEDIERCLGIEHTIEEVTEIPKQTYEIALVEEDQKMLDHEYDIQMLQGESDYRSGKGIVFAVVMAAGMVIIPLCLVFILGIHVLIRWKWVVLAYEILFAVLGIAVYYFLDVGNDRELHTEITDEYGLGELAREIEKEVKETQELQTENHLKTEPEYDLQTTLLISQSELAQKRRLISLSDKGEISVEYFPFLVGKNKGLVDMCLNEPSVSRLHAKLEREGAEYYITDLNSTNGTKINGVLLGANERKQIQIGDELDFAGILFRFQ